MTTQVPELTEAQVELLACDWKVGPRPDYQGPLLTISRDEFDAIVSAGYYHPVSPVAYPEELSGAAQYVPSYRWEPTPLGRKALRKWRRAKRLALSQYRSKGDAVAAQSKGEWA